MKQLISLVILLLMVFFNNSFTHAQENDFPFEVKISGNGKQSIIFIPGFSCSGAVWDDTKSKYEKEFTCHVLTMAGFADAKPQTTITFEHWKTGIANYIKQNNIKQPILIGHSMGGGLAMAIAADYPDLIRKIIVVDALPCLAGLMNPTFKSNENNDCTPIVNQIMAMSDEQFYELQKGSIPRMLEDVSKQELVVSWSVLSDRKTFGQMYCDFSNTDLREKIKTIKCPALILLEASFKNFDPAIKEQYKNLKTADLQYANKGLHFIMYDDVEWYFQQLNKALKVR